jgi:AraC-like DNA-binding protein
MPSVIARLTQWGIWMAVSRGDDMFVQPHAFNATAMRPRREPVAFGVPQRRAEPPITAMGADGGVALRFWRPVHRNCTDIICGESTAHALPMRMYETLQVILPGSRFVVIDGRGRPTPVAPGRMYVTTSFALHWLQSVDDRPFDMRLMLLPASAASTPMAARMRSSDQEPSDQWLVENEALYAELWSAFDDLRAPLAAIDGSSSMMAGLTTIVAGKPAAPPSTASVVERRNGGLARVSEYLRANVTDHVTLDALAVTADLSKCYLLRAFRKAYGLTPHAYQMQLRLARAWRLVAEGKPLSWTAYECGFADQSHLTRRFAGLFGLTPGALARQLTLGAPINRPGSVGRHEISASSAA